MATRASLEVTKGGSLAEPIPLETTISNSSDGDQPKPKGPFPTEEEWATLPRVAGKIPWTAWTVAFVEFAERFSYYGTSAVCKSLVPLFK
jgi:POT family proton-dependent oligopeptide transporter